MLTGGFSGNFSRGDICRICHIQHSDLEKCIHDFTKYGPHSRWTVPEYDNITKQIEDENSSEEEDLAAVTDNNLFAATINEIEEQNNESCEENEFSSNESLVTSDEDQSDIEETSQNTLKFGLRWRCPLNKLSSFHATHSFPADSLHDILEGVVAEDVLGCLRILIKRKLFSQDDYNHALSRHQYKDYEASDRPEKIDIKKKKLRGKAMSLVCHLRNIGMILSSLNLGDGIFSDRVFRILMSLVSIVERILAPALRKYEIVSLEEDIIEYLNERKKIYEEVPKGLNKPKPKMHFMSHYGENIAKFGPTGATWTARYESKHRVGKSIATSGKNFKNIAKTLAERQQYRQASIYYAGMYPTEEVVLPEVVQRKRDLSMKMREESPVFSKLYEFLNDTAVICDNTLFRNQAYKTNDIIVIDMIDQETITVGLIQAICFKDDTMYFLCYKESFLRTFEFGLVVTLSISGLKMCCSQTL